jgi:hypothetical protein
MIPSARCTDVAPPLTAQRGRDRRVPVGLHRTRVSEMRGSRAPGAPTSVSVRTPSAHPSRSTPGHSPGSASGV